MSFMLLTDIISEYNKTQLKTDRIYYRENKRIMKCIYISNYYKNFQWKVQMKINNIIYYLGTYLTLGEAIDVRNKCRNDREFAKQFSLNFGK